MTARPPSAGNPSASAAAHAVRRIIALRRVINRSEWISVRISCALSALVEVRVRRRPSTGSMYLSQMVRGHGGPPCVRYGDESAAAVDRQGRRLDTSNRRALDSAPQRNPRSSPATQRHAMREGIVASAKLPTSEELKAVGRQLGMTLSDADVAFFLETMAGTVAAYHAIEAMADPMPPVKYPRTPGYRPEGADNKYNAWYVKSEVQG